MSDALNAQVARLREGLTIHPRHFDQGRHDDDEQVTAALEAVPLLTPFGGNSLDSLTAILDWDHRIPSKFITLRVLASYSSHETRRVQTQIRARLQGIEADNLFPEFDVPDFDDLTASEIYQLVFDAERLELLDTRFDSTWRKQVNNDDVKTAVGILSEHVPFKRAHSQRRSDAFGGPILMGWCPPCLAQSEHWGIEFWLVTEFDGQSGSALVCIVDIETGVVSKHYMTDVAAR